MDKPTDKQIEDFLANFPDSKQFTEQQLLYLYIPKFQLPEGIQPAQVDILLCPLEHAGYKSRLYFAEKISGLKEARNWNGTTFVLGRSWQAFSWETPAGLTPIQMLASHVRALI
jgi:type IV secretory pathway VirB4 component